jgi:hypothetical protein
MYTEPSPAQPATRLSARTLGATKYKKEIPYARAVYWYSTPYFHYLVFSKIKITMREGVGG